MTISLRPLVFFTGLVIAATFAIWPDNREFIHLLLESGKLDMADSLAPQAIEQNRDDFALLVTAAEVFQRKGKADKAVETMERALELKPKNLEVLERTARYLTWNHRGKESLPYVERILEITPNRPDLLLNLVNAYRYYGMDAEESSAMARYILLSPRFAVNDAPPAGNRTNFMQLAAPVLQNLAKLRLQEGHDVLRDQAMRGMFVLAESYLSEIDDGIVPELHQYLSFFLEQFVLVGMFKEAELLATQWDELLVASRTYRHEYGKLLMWNGLQGRAADYLLALARRPPVDADILRTALEASIAGAEYALAEQALVDLMVVEGSSPRYMRQLGNVQEASQDLAKAAQTYAKIVSSGRGNEHDVRRMLQYSLWSDDFDLLRRNIARIEDPRAHSTEVQELVAQSLLALNEPRDAYPIFKSLYEATGEVDYVRGMLEAAGGSDDPALAGEAFRIARTVFPDDIDLLRSTAESYLALEQPARALPLLRELAIRTEETTDILAYLNAAGYANDPASVRSAAELAEHALQQQEHSQDARLAIQRTLADVYGWVGLEAERARQLVRISDAMPDNLQAALDAAVAADGAQDTDLAIRLYERAHALAPNSDTILASLAERYLWSDRLDDAVAAYQTLETMRTADGLPLEGRLLLAGHAVDNAQWKDAVRYLQPLYAENALDRADVFTLARALFQTGDVEESQAMLMALAERNANDPDFLAELGSEALFSDMDQTAIALFTKSLLADPGQTTALKGLGLAFSAVGEYRHAIDPMRRYLELRKDDAEAGYLLAEFYEAAGFQEDADRAYRHALELMRREADDGNA